MRKTRLVHGAALWFAATFTAWGALSAQVTQRLITGTVVEEGSNVPIPADECNQRNPQPKGCTQVSGI